MMNQAQMVVQARRKEDATSTKEVSFWSQKEVSGTNTFLLWTSTPSTPASFKSIISTLPPSSRSTEKMRYVFLLCDCRLNSRFVVKNGEERIPEPPASDIPQGVLPRLIATLVNRRRQVKGLMKARDITDAQRMQVWISLNRLASSDIGFCKFDIKQQALKLTANSMYGCLGFEYSRFYAMQLAALTTHKGRSILIHSKELAENLNLQVFLLLHFFRLFADMPRYRWFTEILTPSLSIQTSLILKVR